MMKLSDWNNLMEHGKKLCADLKEKGYDVRLRPYTMYDGRKGLYMQVFDSNGKFYKEYASGIDSFSIMKLIMEANARKIVNEC